MMCRVIAPFAERIRREAVSPPRAYKFPLQRRVRILRHRVLRWFGAPIRERREHDLDPSIWRYAFVPVSAVARTAYARPGGRRLTVAGY